MPVLSRTLHSIWQHLNRNAIDLSAVFAAIVSFPSVIFFAIGVIGMVLMGVFAAKLDSADVRSNWIEQLTNTIAQAAIFVGILLLVMAKSHFLR